jgi:DNA-binding response OmpR family regulator
MGRADLDVLIVDDHEAMRAVLMRGLVAAGVGCVRAAADGEAALALLRERPAGVIVVDRHMPGMDGLAFVAAVRGETALADARILMLSGASDASHAEAAQAAGADAVLMKPVTPRELLSAIAALVG